jgi:hypothetical protein
VAVNPDDQEANMAYFKHQQFFQQNHNHVFDLTAHPGAATPLSGIYRCEGCGREVASNAGNPLPPQNHHQHPTHYPIRWRLIAAAKT